MLEESGPVWYQRSVLFSSHAWLNPLTGNLELCRAGSNGKGEKGSSGQSCLLDEPQVQVAPVSTFTCKKELVAEGLEPSCLASSFAVHSARAFRPGNSLNLTELGGTSL